MNIIFEVIDKTGKRIRLTQKQWKHIMKRHSYMQKYLEEIKETLRNPTKIIDHPYDKSYYYKNYKYLKSPNKFVFVIVRYLNGNGFIITAYLTEKIK